MYKIHTENLKILEASIALIQRDLRKYISMEEARNVNIYTKLLSHLVTCWMEVRICKVVYEQNAFSSCNIEQILHSQLSLEEKWIKALNIAICKAYDLSLANPIEMQLSFTNRVKYCELIKIINEDLAPSIQLRNRIAHGQWQYALTNDLRNFSSELTGKLRIDNIVNLQLKIEMFRSLAQIIHDLIVSPPTFERDFDNNYKKFEQQKLNLHKRSYEKYKVSMIAKYKRGFLKRNSQEETGSESN